MAFLEWPFKFLRGFVLNKDKTDTESNESEYGILLGMAFDVVDGVYLPRESIVESQRRRCLTSTQIL